MRFGLRCMAAGMAVGLCLAAGPGVADQPDFKFKRTQIEAAKPKPKSTKLRRAYDKRAKALAGTYRGDLTPRIAYLAESGLDVLPPDALTQYLNDIVSELLDAWPGERPEVHVYVSGSDAFDAGSDQYNNLYVSTGALRQLTNESQVTLLLAHELAHILLRHTSDGFFDFQSKLAKAARWAAVLLIYADDLSFDDGDVVTSSDGEKVAMTHLSYRASQAVAMDILRPMRERGEELEADRLAVDLAQRAGHDPAHVMMVLDRLSEAEAQRRERILALADLAKYFISRRLSAAADQGTFRRLLRGVSAKAVEKAFDELAGAIREYPPLDERKASIRAYIKKFYDPSGPYQPGDYERHTALTTTGDTGRTVSRYEATDQARQAAVEGAMAEAVRLHVASVSGGRVVFSRIRRGFAETRTEQGRLTSAMKNLEYAYEWDQATADVYVGLSFLYAGQGQLDQALAVIDSGVQRLGRDDRLLPARVRAYREANEPEKAARAAMDCLEKGGPVVFALCQEIAGPTVAGHLERLIGEGSDGWLRNLLKDGVEGVSSGQ